MDRERLDAFCREVLADPLASIVAKPFARNILDTTDDELRRLHLRGMQHALNGAADLAVQKLTGTEYQVLGQWATRATRLYFGWGDVTGPTETEERAPCQ